MDRTWMWTVAMIISAAFFAHRSLALLQRYNRTKQLADRPSLSVSEVASRYFANCGVSEDLIAHVWTDISAFLHVDPGKLRPTDELRSLAGWPTWFGPFDSEFNDVHSLLAYVWEHAGNERVDDIRTIGDIVKVVSERMSPN